MADEKPTHETQRSLADALWRIYRRPERPAPWAEGGNLPWNDPDFSRRMLREHLDQSHDAASRTQAARRLQIDWLWAKLGLVEGMRVCDITCGPGLYAVDLALRGCTVTGIDFSPASIAYARNLAAAAGVADRCTFVEQDVRAAQLEPGAYDAALFLYGQLAVFTIADARRLLARAAASLRPGGRLAVELLDPQRIDKAHSTWWYTGDSGLWGDAPYLHLGERFWDEVSAIASERFFVLHLESGRLDQVLLCDQAYEPPVLTELLRQADFSAVDAYPGWDSVPLYDAHEWIAYIAEKKT